MFKNEEGFSLLELVVAVGVAGIIAAVALPTFAGIQSHATSTSATYAASASAAEALANSTLGNTGSTNSTASSSSATSSSNNVNTPTIAIVPPAVVYGKAAGSGAFSAEYLLGVDPSVISFINNSGASSVTIMSADGYSVTFQTPYLTYHIDLFDNVSMNFIPSDPYVNSSYSWGSISDNAGNTDYNSVMNYSGLSNFTYNVTGTYVNWLTAEFIIYVN